MVTHFYFKMCCMSFASCSFIKKTSFFMKEQEANELLSSLRVKTLLDKKILF